MKFITEKLPIILGMLLAILGVLEGFDWTTLFGHNTPIAGSITAIIGGILMVIRPIHKMLSK